MGRDELPLPDRRDAFLIRGAARVCVEPLGVSGLWRTGLTKKRRRNGRRSFELDRKAQRMPASISLVSASIVSGVTTPAPVLSDKPGILYLALITHCTTGMKPCM